MGHLYFVDNRTIDLTVFAAFKGLMDDKKGVDRLHLSNQQKRQAGIPRQFFRRRVAHLPRAPDGAEFRRIGCLLLMVYVVVTQPLKQQNIQLHIILFLP